MPRVTPFRDHIPRHHHVCCACLKSVIAGLPCRWAATENRNGTWDYHYLHTYCDPPLTLGEP